MGRATAAELLEIIRNDGDQLCARLGVEGAQLSLPTDGRGLRVKVSVPAGAVPPDAPLQMEWTLDGKPVEFDLELSEDYEEYSAQPRDSCR